jgi:hypothetical protein
VHVRVAQGRRQHGRLTRALGARAVRVAAILVLTAVAGCGPRETTGTSPPDPFVTLELIPSPPVVGQPTRADLVLRDGAGRPLRGAALQVEGHMTHPGMAPLIAQAVERADGTYTANLTATMAGDWIFVVTGELPGGERIRREVLRAEAIDGPG